eukprot:777457_1
MSEKRASRKRRIIQDESESGPNAKALMADVLEKLKILDYEEKFCNEKGISFVSKSFFAQPSDPSEQFSTFAALVLWLLTEMEHSFIEWTEFEDPNTIATNIIQECKLLGFPHETSANQVKAGSGTMLCQILDFLAAKALESRKFKIRSAEYPQVDDDGDEEDDIEDDIEEDSEDDMPEAENDSSEGEYYGQFGAVRAAGDGDLSDEGEEARAAHEMLEAKVDPHEWQLELERVGPSLRYKPKPDAQEWRSHLNKAVTHSKLIKDEFPPARTQLGKLGTDLSETLKRIRTKEKHLNSEFQGLA